VEGDVDALLTVGSTSDASLDALAGAMAEGASAAGCAPHIDWVHDIDEADRLVTQLAVEHPGAVVLLKGSHASGLSALAERWQALAAQ
jgi:UDP-N-acetylmuramoyl-tripeptide--D-alanyl-D-alanine ligase